MKSGRLVLASLAVGIACGLAGRIVWGADGQATRPPAGAGTTHKWKMLYTGDDKPDPVPELAIDAPTVAKANERGTALLKAARWGVAMDFGHGSLFDGGDWVIGGTGYVSMAVNKATGKPVWPETEPIAEIMAAVAGEKGAEMLITRWARTGGNTLEMTGDPNRTGRWQRPWESGMSGGLITAKQVFTGAVASASFADGRGFSRSSYDQTTRLEVRAYDRATGEKQWSFTLPAKTYTTDPLVLADGVLYVATRPFITGSNIQPPEPTTLMGLDASTGKALFVVPLQEILSAVAVTSGEVIASSSTGELVGFDAKTGKEKWRQRIWLTEKPRSVVLAKQAEPTSESVVAGDVLVVPVCGVPSDTPNLERWEEFPGLAGFDMKTHRQFWFFRPPDFRFIRLEGVQVNKEEIIAAGMLTGLCGSCVSVDVRTGKLNWQLFAGGHEEDILGGMLPLVSDGVMYLMHDGKLMAVPLEGK